MHTSDFDEDPFLSPSSDSNRLEPATPTPASRAQSNSGYSLPAPPPATFTSPSNAIDAFESSPRSRMTALPTSGLEQWTAHMEGRPLSLPLLPFTSRGFCNPDAVPSFHRFDAAASADLSFDIRFMCDTYEHLRANFGLTALQVLLTQLTGTDDFVIGLGRAFKGKRDIIPVRFKGNSQETSNQLLEQTKATMELSQQYRQEPVENLLSELNISKQKLLHQVTFDWIDDAQPTSETTDFYFEHAQDLILVVRENRDRNFVVFVGLDEKTYDKEHAETIAEMYICAMKEEVAQGRKSVIDMDLILSADRDKTMARGAGPEIQVSFSSVLEKLQEISTATPNQVAVKDEQNHKITYVDLIRRAIAMSSDLKKHGLARGSPVCVMGPPTIDLVCSIVAIWCAGGIYVPIDHRLSFDDNVPIVKNSDADFCIVSTPDLIDYALRLQLGTLFYCGDMAFIEGFDNVGELLSDDLAVGSHLPSSDGVPKGVMITHENLNILVASAGYYFENEKAIVLQHTNWTSELALFQILFALTSGGTLFLASDPSPVNVTKIMVHQKITTTIATPSDYSLWFQHPRHMLKDCKSWRSALIGGENISSTIIRNFTELRLDNLDLISFYGATETTIACCMGFVVYKEYAGDKDGLLIPAGTASPNYQIWVGDHLGRSLPTAWTGDIWVAGPGVGPGYFGSKADSHRFQSHPRTGVKCFRTGDWGFINDTGVLFVISRRLEESVAQIGGFHIELGDISRTIVNQAKGKVIEALVVLRSVNEAEEPQLLAFVVMNGAVKAATRRGLQKLLRALNLPAYMRPKRAVICNELPRTSGGKIDRRVAMTTAISDNEIIRVM
jgi:acyl-CoA synthetase (AMP-forming)/AMP-acid ligase II